MKKARGACQISSAKKFWQEVLKFEWFNGQVSDRMIRSDYRHVDGIMELYTELSLQCRLGNNGWIVSCLCVELHFSISLFLWQGFISEAFIGSKICNWFGHFVKYNSKKTQVNLYFWLNPADKIQKYAKINQNMQAAWAKI